MARLNLDAVDARDLLMPESEQVALYLVGNGGTGSWLAPHLVRIARLFHDLHGLDTRIMFIDKDKVEERNTYRQNFVPAEIGHFKAEALALRYSLSAGCAITALNKPFVASEFRGRVENATLSVFVGCVDNAAARSELESMITVVQSKKFNVLLDCGNDRRSGQVIVGTTPSGDKNPFKLFPNHCTWLPKPSVWHKELASEGVLEKKIGIRRSVRNGKRAREMSCAEIAMTDQQGLSINAVIASIAADYLVSILLTQNLNRFATYVDLDGSMKHRYITPRIIKRKTLKESLRGVYDLY